MKLNSLMRMLNAFCMKRLIVYLNNVAVSLLKVN